MQALKALVIFLGVLLVVGMGLFAYGIVVKFGSVTDAGESPAEAASGTPWPKDARVQVPSGTEVLDAFVAEGRITIRVALPDGGERFIVFDLASGQRLGAIDLVPSGGGG